MIHAKGLPSPPPPAAVEAHRAALEPLTDTYADQTFQGPWG